MPISGIHTGVIAPGAYLPAQPPQGVLPPEKTFPDLGRAPFEKLGQQFRQQVQSRVYPPTAPGDGFIHATTRQQSGMDVVNGFDRTLGKTQIINQSEKVAQRSKNLGNLSTARALGPLAGRIGHMYL